MWQAFFPLNFKKALFLKESCSEIWLFQQTEHPHDEDKWQKLEMEKMSKVTLPNFLASTEIFTQ